jgi:hypothetical protein
MSILIPIISEFNAKGFKDAQKQTSLLDKGLKRLAVTLGTALSVRKITQFSKASVKAFLEEDKAVQALATNLSNLGLAYDVRPVENYIKQLQYATGVADGELRPALQQLVTSTRDLALSQELLALSLDIAAGTGRSLSSVTQALGRAYLGTNTSLTRLNIGLSKADLTSKSFNEITKELTDRFAGQAARAAGTYAGQVAILSAAAQDAQEILGEKLVKSIELLLDEETGVPALASKFEAMATYTGNVALGIADIIREVKTLGGLTSGSNLSAGSILRGFPLAEIPLRRWEQRGARITASETAKAEAIARANAKEQGMARSRTLITEKKITAEKTKQNKISKDTQKLEEAGKTFNDELISLEAALTNEKLSQNEILRLQLKKALINENADRAATLADKLAKSQEELKRLQDFQLTNNPFANWMSELDKFREKLAQTTGQSIFGNRDVESISKNPPAYFTDPGFNFAVPDFDYGSVGNGGILGMPPQQTSSTVNVYVQGTGGLDAETKQAVVDAVVEASSSGYSTNWFRTTARATL